MSKDLVFLDTILLQQDLRVRLPKSLIVNIEGKPGKTHLNVYFDAISKNIILKCVESETDDE